MNGSQGLWVTTDAIPRTLFATLPAGFEVVCTHTTGWQFWFHAKDDTGELVSVKLAEEFPMAGTHGLRLEVQGFVICDSLKRN